MVSLLAVKLLRDTRRQWLQFGAVALTLALGVAVFGAAFDSYDNLKTSYAEIYRRLDFADATVTGGDTDVIAAEARPTAGVVAVATRREADVPLRLGGGDNEYTLVGRAVGDATGGPVNRLLVQTGTALDPSRRDAVVVERHMADHFGLHIGDTVEVFGLGRWEPLHIVGIAVSPEYLWPARDRQDLLTSPDDFGVLFVPDSLLATIGPEAATTEALVRYQPGADRARLDGRLREIATAHGPGDLLVRADQPSYAALQQDVDGFRELALLFPVLFLVAGGLAAYVLLGRLVRAQRGSIGMLAANGYPPGRLRRHYLAFGAVAGVAGSALGAAGGLGLAVLLTHAYTSSLTVPLAVARFHVLTPLTGIALGTIAGVAAAAGPARAATRVTPAEAMRGTAPGGVAHRNLVDHHPGVRRLPVRWRVPLRNVERNPRRAVSTATGVILAAVLLLSSLGMLDTISLVLDDQFHHVQRQDAELYLSAAPDRELQAAVATVDGVAAVEPAVEAPVVLTAGGRRYQTVLTGLKPDTTMHRFPHHLPSNGLVLGDALRSMLGVSVGQTVDVVVGDAPPVAVVIAGFVHEPLGSLAYATGDVAQRLAGVGAQHSLLVRYAPGVSPEVMRHRLAGQPGVVAFRDVRGSERAVRQLLGLFYAIVGVMLVFGSILALVVLFNTLSVNLAERTVELATLRAAGGRLPALARMVTGENLVLVVAAIPPGLVAGWATGRWLMNSFNSDLYHFTLRLRPTTPLLVAGALVVVTLLSHLPARRNLARIDIPRVVRERAL